ncbi:S8 family serine peptidase [Psychroserpens sp. XS_ASV72]|uniref:S8 family serine peptidase n=1 Tax=Psychroserpens sp. XS_ASV72 TaxID=3241293 RepID=UPI0035113B51
MIKTLQFLCFFIGINALAQIQISQEYAEGQIIAKFKQTQNSHTDYSEFFQTTDLQSINNQINVSNLKVIGNKKAKNTYLISYNASISVENVIEMYRDTNMFEYVEPNYKCSGSGIPNDPLLLTRQWSMVNNGTFSLSPATIDADIDMDLAWDITTGDPNLIVAILDSGMRMSHPEVSTRIWVNSSEIVDGNDSDNNNYVDDIYGGWDFANDDNNPTDDHGHGTNVGGIAVATGNNGIGYAGVNWNSQIMVIKILDENNSGFYSWMGDGIYYAVDNGADVMNMSVGGNSPSSFLLDAVDYAYANDVALVVSTGNGDTALQYPSRYANSIAVGSTNPDDSRTSPFFWSPTSGSNYGPEIDLVAPGNYIYGLSHTSDTNYNGYWGGTSQAAPHVAGVISLMLSVNPNLSVDQINAILIQTSEDQVGDPIEDTPGFDNYHGYGRLNAHLALTSDLLSVESFDQSDISLFPNPIRKDQMLNFGNLKPGSYNISVHTITGQKIINFELEADGQVAQTKLPTINTGIYLLEIQNTLTKTSAIKKLIVR